MSAKRKRVGAVERAAELGRELQKNPEIVHRVHVGQCLTFVRFAIEHASDLAKSNQKDEARYWSRFLVNSQILEVLEHVSRPDAVSQLRIGLSRLHGEVHPADVPDYTCDLAAIRGHLEELLRRTGGLEQQSPSLSVVSK